ncbi:hypothetical protein ACXOKJ_08390, partial [Streptococcus thermophilus]
MTRSFLRKYRIVIFYILSHKLGKSLYYLYLRTRYFFILEYNKDFENFRQSHLTFRHADQAFFLLLGGLFLFFDESYWEKSYATDPHQLPSR